MPHPLFPRARARFSAGDLNGIVSFSAETSVNRHGGEQLSRPLATENQQLIRSPHFTKPRCIPHDRRYRKSFHAHRSVPVLRCSPGVMVHPALTLRSFPQRGLQSPIPRALFIIWYSLSSIVNVDFLFSKILCSLYIANLTIYTIHYIDSFWKQTSTQL